MKTQKKQGDERNISGTPCKYSQILLVYYDISHSINCPFGMERCFCNNNFRWDYFHSWGNILCIGAVALRQLFFNMMV